MGGQGCCFYYFESGQVRLYCVVPQGCSLLNGFAVRKKIQLFSIYFKIKGGGGQGYQCLLCAKSPKWKYAFLLIVSQTQ